MRSLVSLALAGALALSALVPTALTPQVQAAEQTPEQILAKMNLDQKVGQLLWTHVYGDSADDATYGSDNQAIFGTGISTPAQAVKKYHLGGVLYFNWAHNFSSENTDVTKVAALSNGLQAAAKADGNVPLGITIDQEGGMVSRVGAPATIFPGNMALGATANQSLAYSQGQVLGCEMRSLGINADFAPVLDVNTNPNNPVIGLRAISDDPNLVAQLGGAQIQGIQSQGVSATAKHFPGHGDADTDSHLGLPRVTYSRQVLNQHLVPFKTAISSGVDMIMTAHIVVDAIDPKLPATLSKPVLTGLLRQELGFTGVITTDALDMEGAQLAVMTPAEQAKYKELKNKEDSAKQKADKDPTQADSAREASTEFKNFLAPIRARVAVKALQAGSDILLNTKDAAAVVDGVKAAVKDGSLTSAQIDQSVLRILKWKQKRGVLKTEPIDTASVKAKLGTPASKDVARQIARDSVTLLRNDSKGKAPLDAAKGTRVLVAGSSWANPELLPDPLKAAGFSVVFTQDADAKEDPSDSEISAWVRQAANVDTVIFASYAPGAQQFKAIDALVATGKQVIVINTSLPYPLARYRSGTPGPQVVVEIYANNSVALAAAVDVLSGQASALGKLPVSVPGGSGVAYARGFGLGAGSATPTATAPATMAPLTAAPTVATTATAAAATAPAAALAPSTCEAGAAKSTTKPSASLAAAPSPTKSPKRGLAHSGVETGLFGAFALTLLGGGLALRSRTR